MQGQICATETHRHDELQIDHALRADVRMNVLKIGTHIMLRHPDVHARPQSIALLASRVKPDIYLLLTGTNGRREMTCIPREMEGVEEEAVFVVVVVVEAREEEGVIPATTVTSR